MIILRSFAVAIPIGVYVEEKTTKLREDKLDFSWCTRISHAPRMPFLCVMFCSYLNVFIYNKHLVVFQLKWFKWVYHAVWEMANVLDIQRKGNVVPEEQNYLSADREMFVFNSSGLWWKFPKSKDDLTKGKWMLIRIFCFK